MTPLIYSRIMRTSAIVYSLLVLACGLGCAAEGDGLRGAAAILADLHASEVKADAVGKAVLTSSELTAFAANPARDAAGWLEFARRLTPVEPRQFQGENRDPQTSPASSAELLAALPVPAHWPAIVTGLRAHAETLPAAQARQAAAWRLIAATLAMDLPAQHEALAMAHAASGRHGGGNLERADVALIDSEDDPQAVVQAVERRVMAVAKNTYASLELPDLLPLVGEPRTLAVIRSALSLNLQDFKVTGRRTRALAVREALARIDTLKFAPWGLIHDADSVPLFEALEKKFPSTTGERSNRWYRELAEAAYLTQLIIGQRNADVVARLEQAGKRSERLLQQLPLDDLAEHRPQELCDLLRDLLRKEPERPLWSIYGQLAGQLGRAEELQQMLHDHRAAAAHQGQLIELLLAADDVDGAVVAIRAQLEVQLHPPAPVTPKVEDAAAATDEDEDEDQPTESRPAGNELALRLLTLGTVLKRPELVSEAVVAYGVLPASPTNAWDQEASRRTQLLVTNGQAVLAEHLLAASLALPAKHEWDNAAVGALAGLVRLYVAVGRSADAVTLLTSAEDWGVEDFSQLHDGADSHEGRPPLAVVAGTAFAEVGKPVEARRLALLALDQEPACDAAYVLLRRLDGAQAGEVCERLRRSDALEERPLIWLAQLQLDAGQPAAAEKLARLAMEMDPSDGDQGPGDRMRARAVLAEALAKLGRADEAKPLQTVIAAIRAGEAADVLLRAGLATRAAEAYRVSEAILDRTYCVQSRMAVTLAKLGRDKEAAVHFRRAFELMPKAFGRMESHCFGCEGVFGGVDAKRIAEEVFTGLVEREPKNPRHQYLLGYLRSQQERHADAASAFRAAIALDPDYFNAISHLLELDDELRLPRAERERLALALMRLDPGHHHHQVAVDQIRDLGALFTLVAAHAEEIRLAPRPVLTMPKPAKPAQINSWHSYADERASFASPGAVVAQHSLLQTAISLLDDSE